MFKLQRKPRFGFFQSEVSKTFKHPDWLKIDAPMTKYLGVYVVRFYGIYNFETHKLVR